MCVADTCCRRPASPLFIPKKHGVDKESQVDGDLFNFDFEVKQLHQRARARVS